mmetsp:Transcript_5440/g.6762  ORF Transcript_5440/g.6762 Transcript_5440/m.6762 type:complete len:271 (-) Transcript_5440:215-1027(-)
MIFSRVLFKASCSFTSDVTMPCFSLATLLAASYTFCTSRALSSSSFNFSFLPSVALAIFSSSLDAFSAAAAAFFAFISACFTFIIASSTARDAASATLLQASLFFRCFFTGSPPASIIFFCNLSVSASSFFRCSATTLIFPLRPSISSSSPLIFAMSSSESSQCPEARKSLFLFSRSITFASAPSMVISSFGSSFRSLVSLARRSRCSCSRPRVSERKDASSSSNFCTTSSSADTSCCVTPPAAGMATALIPPRLTDLPPPDMVPLVSIS